MVTVGAEAIATAPRVDEALTLVELDLNQLHRTRARLPVLRDERTALVQREMNRILSDREQPGNDIFIHGKNVTIGCLPMGDEGIEQIYIAAIDAQKKPVKVHIFPARMSGDAWNAFVAEKPALAAFWAQLQPAYDYFEQHHMVPDFTVQPDGSYRINAFPR